MKRYSAIIIAAIVVIIALLPSFRLVRSSILKFADGKTSDSARTYKESPGASSETSPVSKGRAEAALLTGKFALDERPTNPEQKAIIDRRRASESHRMVDEVYAPILNSLKLTSAQLDAIKQILYQRLLSRYDVRDLVMLKHLKMSDYNVLIANSDAEIDQEMKAMIDPESYSILQRMTGVTGELSDLKINYIPEFDSSGNALNPQQYLSLGEVFHDHDQAVPLAEHVEGYDPTTGLAAIDRAILGKASGILSRDQISILKKGLSAVTARYVALSNFKKNEGPN